MLLYTVEYYCSFIFNPSHLLSLLFFFLIHPIYYRCLSFLSLPPTCSSRASDPGSHSRLFFPLPSTVRALHFYRHKIGALSSLVDSRRIVPTHAINRRAQELLIPFFIFANKFKISPVGRDSNSRTDATSMNSSIRG